MTGRRTIRRQTIAEFASRPHRSHARRRSSSRQVPPRRPRRRRRARDPPPDVRSAPRRRRRRGARSPHTHVRLGLSDGRELRFVDPRTFGELFVTDDLDERRVPLVLSALGRDPIVDGFEPAVARRPPARSEGRAEGVPARPAPGRVASATSTPTRSASPRSSRRFAAPRP